MRDTTTARRAPRSLLAFLREGRGENSAVSARAATGAKKRSWGPKRIIALSMMLLVPLIGVFGATAATAAEKPDTYPFYNLASSTTAFFSTMQEPGNTEGFSQEWHDLMKNPGSAGSLLGYADRNVSDFGGWLFSGISSSSDAIGYETLRVRNGDESGSAGFDSGENQGLVDYAYFGAALKGMGLDTMRTGLSLNFMGMISGGVIMGLYIVSGAVDFVFNSFIGILNLLNPFKLFYAGVSAISPDFADGMVGGGDAAVGPLSGLANWIGGWYQVLNSMSWTVMVPIFIAVLVLSLFLFKKVDKGGAFKKIVIRVAFIGLGLPLLGSMYTGMLSSMSDAASEGNTGSTRVVMSTYVDFENWAMSNRLTIPAGATIAWDPEGAQPTGQAQSNVRNTALAINNQTHKLGLTPIVSSGAFDASWSNQIMEGNADENATQPSAYDVTIDMLMRFMGGAQMTSAAFETAAQGNLTKSTFFGNDGGASAGKWFENIQQDSKGLNVLAGDSSPQRNPLIAVAANTGLQGSDGAGGRQLTSITTLCSNSGAQISRYNGDVRECNLAPLAMYNYLNTDFGPTSMTMYSSTNAMSEATRSIHQSVSQVGTGTMSFLYWFNAVVLLGSFVLIGLGYAFSMLFASIRRSFQVVTAVPFATLGAIAAIAKVVVYSIAMIVEVILTIFVYKMVQEFLTSLPQIIEMPFAEVLSNGGAGDLATFITFLTSGWAFSLVVTLLSIIGVLAFTVLALRMRKTLVKAVEEAVTKIVEKFMDTQVGMPGGGKMLPALAGGAAAGAGAAAANRMMSGRAGKGAVGNALPGTSDAAPSSVETGKGASTTAAPTDGAPSDGPAAVEGGGTLELEAGGGAAPDSGSPIGSSTTGRSDTTAADEVKMGREVEANGLTKPEENAPTNEKSGDGPRAPRVGDDAMSSASNSMDESNEGFKEADKKKLEAGTETAKAAGHAGIALARGSAGDAAGATESAGRAVEHGGKAVAAGERAKQAEADAGRSSLDKPDQRHAKRASQAEKVSQVGGSVANGAGAVNGASGSAAPGKGSRGKAPSGSSQPAKSTPKAPKPAPKQLSNAPKAAPPAPKSAPKPAPKAAPPAPKSAPKPAPKAPQVAQQPAPKPAPKAPQPVQKPAPKPAPKAPQVAQRPAPKPAPRAPQAPPKAAVRRTEKAARRIDADVNLDHDVDF